MLFLEAFKKITRRYSKWKVYKLIYVFRMIYQQHLHNKIVWIEYGLYDITLLISIKRDHKLKRSIVFIVNTKNLRIHKIRTQQVVKVWTVLMIIIMKIWYLVMNTYFSLYMFIIKVTSKRIFKLIIISMFNSPTVGHSVF